MAIFYGRNLNLASIWQIIRGLVKNAHSISAMIFLFHIFLFISLHRIGFWISIKAQFKQCALSWHEVCQASPKRPFIQRGGYHFPGRGGGKCQDLNCTGVPLSAMKNFKSRAKTGFTSSYINVYSVNLWLILLDTFLSPNSLTVNSQYKKLSKSLRQHLQCSNKFQYQHSLRMRVESFFSTQIKPHSEMYVFTS